MKKIVEKSKKLGVSTYFFNYQSEINNLNGRINIFLNKNQSDKHIKNDFDCLIKMIKRFECGTIEAAAPISSVHEKGVNRNEIAQNE